MTRSSRGGRPGGTWTTDPRGRPTSRGVEVMREETVAGMKPVRTVVYWKRPSDGEDLVLEIDVFGIIDPKTGLIAGNLCHSLLALCPRCAPNAPQGSPVGQILMRGYDVKPHFDERGRLWTEEVIRCSWLCGWRVKIREGRAYDERGGRNLFSKIAWDW